MANRFRMAGARRGLRDIRDAASNRSLSKAELKAAKDMFGIESKRTKLAFKRSEALKEERQILSQTAESIKSEYEMTKALLADTSDMSRQEIENTRRRFDSLKALNGLNEDQLDLLRAQNEEDQKRIKNYEEALKKQKEGLREIASGIKNVAQEIAGIEDRSSKSVDSLLSGFDKMTTNFTGFGDIVKNTFGLLIGNGNIFSKVIGGLNGGLNNLISAFFKVNMILKKDMDQAFANLSKYTGTVGELSGRLSSLAIGTQGLMSTYQEAGIVLENLDRSSVAFRDNLGGQERQMMRTALIFSRFGIDVGGLGKTFDLLMKGLQMSGRQADETAKNIFALGKTLKIPPSVIMNEYQQSLGALMKYGKEASRVFGDVAGISAKTGIEISRLLDITQKFDTFEGAAKAAQQMNAILGGPYLNSVKLLRLEEGERILYMKEMVERSGKSIDSLNRFEKQALASAGGFKDVGEMMKMMGASATDMNEAMNTAADGKYIDGMGAAAKATKTQSEQLQGAIDNVFKSNKFVQMIRGYMDDLIGWLGKFNGASENFEKVGKIAGGLKIAFGAAGMLGSFLKLKGVLSDGDGIIFSMIRLYGYATATAFVLKSIKDFRAGEGGFFATTLEFAAKAIESFNSMKDSASMMFVEMRISLKETAMMFEDIYAIVKDVALAAVDPAGFAGKMVLGKTNIQELRDSKDRKQDIQELKKLKDQKAAMIKEEEDKKEKIKNIDTRLKDLSEKRKDTISAINDLLGEQILLQSRLGGYGYMDEGQLAAARSLLDSQLSAQRGSLAVTEPQMQSLVSERDVASQGGVYASIQQLIAQARRNDPTYTREFDTGRRAENVLKGFDGRVIYATEKQAAAYRRATKTGGLSYLDSIQLRSDLVTGGRSPLGGGGFASIEASALSRGDLPEDAAYLISADGKLIPRSIAQQGLDQEERIVRYTPSYSGVDQDFGISEKALRASGNEFMASAFGLASGGKDAGAFAADTGKKFLDVYGKPFKDVYAYGIPLIDEMASVAIPAMQEGFNWISSDETKKEVTDKVSELIGGAGGAAEKMVPEVSKAVLEGVKDALPRTSFVLKFDDETIGNLAAKLSEVMGGMVRQ